MQIKSKQEQIIWIYLNHCSIHSDRTHTASYCSNFLFVFLIPAVRCAWRSSGVFSVYVAVIV